jgi:hypothetical protein
MGDHRPPDGRTGDWLTGLQPTGRSGRGESERETGYSALQQKSDVSDSSKANGKTVRRYSRRDPPYQFTHCISGMGVRNGGG